MVRPTADSNCRDDALHGSAVTPHYLLALVLVAHLVVGCSARNERPLDSGALVPADRGAPSAADCSCPETHEEGSLRDAGRTGSPAVEAAEPWVVGDDGIVALPEPDLEGGMPLMRALQARHTAREFSERRLPLRVLSELLWAAQGVNRESGRRTAPSAHNRQEIDVYLATAEGLFQYDATSHRLTRRSTTDLRAETGSQEFVAAAPLTLIYVADFARMGGRSDEERREVAAADTAFIGQNVYLFCASAGLAAVFRGSVDREALGRAMGLSPSQHVTFAQTLGYPAE